MNIITSMSHPFRLPPRHVCIVALMMSDPWTRTDEAFVSHRYPATNPVYTYVVEFDTLRYGSSVKVTILRLMWVELRVCGSEHHNKHVASISGTSHACLYRRADDVWSRSCASSTCIASIFSSDESRVYVRRANTV